MKDTNGTGDIFHSKTCFYGYLNRNRNRKHTDAVRNLLNTDELKSLNIKRSTFRKGEKLQMAYLH